MPRWRDLDIGLLRNVLPYVWSWQYDRASDEFTGKLAGEAILGVIGRGFRGAKAREYFKQMQRDEILARYHTILRERVGMVTTGMVFYHAGSSATGQRVALPVATGAECEPDTVLGVTIYTFKSSPKRDIRAEIVAAVVDRFTLEGGLTAD